MDRITIDSSNELEPVVVDTTPDRILINPTTTTSGGSGTTDHSLLINRSISNQHPISAISGLQPELDKIIVNEEDIGNLQDLYSTSWHEGAIVSINAGDPSTFDISEGDGFHVDHSVHPPVITHVVVNAQTGVAVTNIGTQTTTEIAVDINGNLVQQFRYTSAERRDVFSIGSLAHPNLTTITSAQNLARVIDHEVVLGLSDLALALGSLTISGLIIQPNGLNLNINVTAGNTYVIGINKDDIKDSNHVHSDSIPLATFFRIWQDGAGGFNILPSTTIDPNNYDDSTGGVGVPNGNVLPNKWQLVRVYVFPVDGPEISSVVVHYGTATFGTAEEALSDPGISYIPHPVLDNAVHRANIAVVQGATDLSNGAEAIFQSVGKFGSSASGGGVGGAVSDHELLSNLLGGAINQHYHLDLPEHTLLTSEIINLIAGETIGSNRVITSDAMIADNITSTVNTIIGVTTAAATIGNPIQIQMKGNMGGLTGLTPNLPLFLSTVGTLTQTPPVTGFIQQIAIATSATTIVLNIQPPIQL